jgi:hypothetical protein
VSRTRCGILHAAAQSRDRHEHRSLLRPRLCSASLREERSLCSGRAKRGPECAALRPGNGYFFATPFAGGAFAGTTGFFGAGVFSAAALMSSISFVTREALLPRSLSK